MNQFQILKYFINPQQLATLNSLCENSEEAEYFQCLRDVLVDTITLMPHTYQTDGQGDAAIAHLRYFWTNGEAYVSEKDMGSPNDENPLIQQQAFGLVKFAGNDAELGYISIQELLDNGAELDYHYSPTTLKEIKESFQ